MHCRNQWLGLKTLFFVCLVFFSSLSLANCNLFNRTWKQELQQELLENIKKKGQNYWKLYSKLPSPLLLGSAGVWLEALSCYWDTTNEQQYHRHPCSSQEETETAVTVWDFGPLPSHLLAAVSSWVAGRQTPRVHPQPSQHPLQKQGKEGALAAEYLQSRLESCRPWACF